MIPKFRAWHTHKQIMCKVIRIDFEQEIVTLDLETDDDEYFWIETDWSFSDVEIMQSTGLKDKNGVEIYEGDIVRYTWDSPSDVNATEKGKKVRISKVFWSDWRASWAVGKKSCNDNLFRFARNGNTVEVIGNIYENPELLEVAE